MESVYIVIRSIDVQNRVGGVINLIHHFNQITTWNCLIHRYKPTRRYGHDMSLFIIEVGGKNPLKSAKWILFEIYKRLDPNIEQFSFPKPNTKLWYLSIPTFVEIVGDEDKIYPFFKAISERNELHKKERVFNDVELMNKNI